MAVTRVDRKTGLQETSWTTVLQVDGRGALRNLRWNDPDAEAGNDEIRVTIDGDVMFTGAKNLAAVEELDLIQSMLQNTIVVNTDEGVRSRQRLPFHRVLLIEYKRAAAGASGINVTTHFEIKSQS